MSSSSLESSSKSSWLASFVCHPSFIAFLVYVDHILLTGDSKAELEAVKSHVDALFIIKDLGHAKYFLDLESARSDHGFLVTQQKYLLDILQHVHMLDARETSTPFSPGRLVGHLFYLGFTRPDVSFTVQQLSLFLQRPRTSHWDAAMHILRYLKGSPSHITTAFSPLFLLTSPGPPA
ncbi:UNVERIFIED_CONTAM: hypothetical protein Sindi_0537100 [Sesamum indicum]